jgi:hypothetical protein
VTTVELDIEIPDLVAVEIETPAAEVNPSSGGETVLLVATPGPPGPPGAGVPVVGEPLAGTKDGVNTVFTTASAFRAATTAFYLNGLREFHYTETGASEITLEDAPDSDDTLRVDYVI